MSKPPLSGRLLRFPGALLLCAGGVFFWNCGGEETPEAGPAADRPNILLISIDSCRADRLGFLGHRSRFALEVPVSPALDALAAESAVFDNAWSSSSWTLPAHMALFTGMSDPSHGVFLEDFRLDPLRQTLAEVLQQEGYTTYGVYSGPLLDPRHGFDRGFDEWYSAMMPPSEVAQALENWAARRRDRGLPEPTAEEVRKIQAKVAHWDLTSPRVTDAALEFLHQQTASEAPFFLFLHFFDVHYDYVPEQGDAQLATLFDPGYTGTLDGTDWYSSPAVRERDKRILSDRDLQHVEALYDGEIHWVDRHVGSVLQRLQQLGLDQNTVIGVVTDHGDEFFEHGSIGHRRTLHSEVARTAMTLKVPQLTTGGATLHTPVSLIDMAPTLLEAVGLPLWEQAEGRNLMPELRGEAVAPAQRHGVFSHLFVDSENGPRLFESWRDLRFSVIRPFAVNPQVTDALAFHPLRFPDGEAFYLVYDRLSDPLEQRPIPPTEAFFQRAVSRFEQDFYRAKKARAQLPWSPMDLRYASELSDRQRAVLEALGYQEGRGETRQGREQAPPLAPLPDPPH